MFSYALQGQLTLFYQSWLLWFYVCLLLTGHVHIDTYLENLKGCLCSLEVENDKLSDEIWSLMKDYLEGSIQLQSNIEGLSSSLEFIQTEGLGTKRAEHQPEYGGAHDGCMFKILELNSHIEKKKGMLKSLEDLDYKFKR
ncbi:hypothetical protein L1987_58067 [Smallanthus sonchifolius]|uniref:Uncharacterized protein n=1 Tax=Smallanthus sonchifolius TaxID=185202 RepID=A0ACB9DE84_9ASTR|nr:hypothetical protein L1987_58067 [Smallanthus sonchifolius]